MAEVLRIRGRASSKSLVLVAATAEVLLAVLR